MLQFAWYNLPSPKPGFNRRSKPSKIWPSVSASDAVIDRPFVTGAQLGQCQQFTAKLALSY